jgi:alpha-amylase
MWPISMKEILDKVDDLNPEFGFASGDRPFIFQEVIDMGGEPITANEYTGNGRVTEFKYGAKLGRVFRKFDQARWLNNFGRYTGKRLQNRFA